MSYYRPVIYLSSVHQPLPAGDYVDPATIPISHVAFNELRILSDGLYSGPYLAKQIYYVDPATGVDDLAHGDKATPLKTLDYALSVLQSQNIGTFHANATIALKCGQTFTRDDSFNSVGSLVITFWGDPQYGDFNDGAYFGVARANLSDLQRPVINFNIAPATVGGLSCFNIAQAPNGTQPSITFEGVRLNLPTAVHVTGAYNIVEASPGTNLVMALKGCVVNANDDTSIYGVLGVQAQSQCFLYQFATQFLVGGVQVGSGSSVQQLQRRQWFLKMFLDYAAIHQDGISENFGSPGTGLLSLSWTDTPTGTLPNGHTVQATYPVLADPNYGLAPYFLNLYRDQQQRPLNVISGRLF